MGKYVVTITFNYGRDLASRKVVSEHKSPTAALNAWYAARNENGWLPAIECSNDAKEMLASAAIELAAVVYPRKADELKRFAREIPAQQG